MTEEVIFLSPAQARKLLKVEANALKKYVLLLEKAGYSLIEKDAKGHRRYSPYDVITLQNFLQFKESGMSLEDATVMVMEQVKLDGKLDERNVITVEEPSAYNVMMKQIRQELKEELKREIKRELREEIRAEIQAEMDRTYVTKAELEDQVISMSRKERIESEERAQIELSAAEISAGVNKKSWWQRLIGK
jgi:DNA-binding transcriptional MerR regulator